MYQLIIFLLLAALFISLPASAGKKHCKPLLDKLHNIQALQRHGYSSKRGTSLRAREDKAREKWWQCEKNTKAYKRKSKKSSAKVKQKTPPKSGKIITAGTPFSTQRAIVIKSQYQGEKKRAWLAFYQQPKKCQRPKNLQVFAFCSENKQTQRSAFESAYGK